jgi:hypothetical protein
MHAHANTRTQGLSPTHCISLYLRLFWRSSHDTFQYLASHVRGDLGRATRPDTYTIKRGLLRGFCAKLVTALYGHLWYCGVVMSGKVTCPQAVSRESHRTRNKNKQSNKACEPRRSLRAVWHSLEYSKTQTTQHTVCCILDHA